MGYSDYLKTLLRPLGLYKLEDSWNGYELDSYGQQLDRCNTMQEELETEMCPLTAADWGLTQYLQLLKYQPVATDTQGLRTALLALLRIDNSAFTPDAIQDSLLGCGVSATVRETDDPMQVEVRFSGEPEHFDQVQKIIEEIIPCHLSILYLFWSTTWGYFTTQALTWGSLDNGSNSWNSVMSLGNE